ncbi:MAG: extracellular solute-binding protein [Victivallales bacterium]|jgi:ABC-type glycerol-3-phosphate transport system substrate-binding protein
MQDKTSIIRDHILTKLESGALRCGDKLPGAREIASETKISFLMVQKALATLTQEGLLRTEARRGTYLADNLSNLPLHNCISSFYSRYPWFSGFKELLGSRMPSIKIMKYDFNCLFEMRVTLDSQRRQDEYLDLSDVFANEFPDSEIFFKEPFRPFRTQSGKLIGVPFIFSPRVIFYNPALLESANCPLPYPGWSWKDFIKSIRILRKVLPPNRVFNWELAANMWMNFVFRAGGRLLAPEEADPVWIDHPRTRCGLSHFAELKDAIGVDDSYNIDDYDSAFARGETAFALEPRQILPLMRAKSFDQWGVVPLPLLENGIELNTQATDVICVRKGCQDKKLVAKLLRVLLSEEMQDFVGTAGYGLPVRKSSAFKGIDFSDSRDTLFLHEMPKMSAEYRLDSPELSNLVQEGINQIWRGGNTVESATGELAQAVRTFLRIRGNASQGQFSTAAVHSAASL